MFSRCVFPSRPLRGSAGRGSVIRVDGGRRLDAVSFSNPLLSMLILPKLECLPALCRAHSLWEVQANTARHYSRTLNLLLI